MITSIQCVGVDEWALFIELRGRRSLIRLDITPPPLGMSFKPTVWLDASQARALAAALIRQADDIELRQEGQRDDV